MVLSIRTGLFRGLLSPNVLIRTIGNYLVFCESYAFQIISVAHGAIFSTDRRFRFKFSALISQHPERDIGIRLCVSRMRYTSSTKDDSKEEDGRRSSPLLHSVAFFKGLFVEESFQNTDSFSGACDSRGSQRAASSAPLCYLKKIPTNL